MEAIVLSGQSLFDIAIQYTGDVHNAVLIAISNDIDVTDDLSAGTILNIPETLLQNARIVEYYANRKITPATITDITEDLKRIFGEEFPIQFS